MLLSPFLAERGKGEKLMNSKSHHFILAGVLCVLLIGVMLFPATASAQTGDNDVTRQELVNFDKFLDSHPAIDQDLKKTPGLVNDPTYLAAHPELKEFLGTHQGVREEIRENPTGF